MIIKKTQLDDYEQFLKDKNNKPYQILKCSKHDSQDQIHKNYKKLRLKVLENQSINKEEELKKLDFAYQLLSDETCKEMYDQKIEYEEGLKRDTKNLQFKTMDLFISLLGFASERSLIRVQTLPLSTHISMIQDSKLVVQEVYKRGGLEGFYRGFTFLLIYPLVEVVRLISTNTIYKLVVGLKSNSGKEDGNQIESNIYTNFNLVSASLVRYPFKMLSEVMALSPPEISTFKIFKLMLFGGKNTGSGSYLSFWYHGINYYIGIGIINAILKQIINKVGVKINESYQLSKIKSNDGNGNSILKYLDLIYNSKVGRVSLKILFCIPFYCIRSYYSLEILNSILNNSPLPKPVSPISTFLQIYSKDGISRFYNGSIFMLISRLSKTLLYDFVIDQNDLDIFD